MKFDCLSATVLNGIRWAALVGLLVALPGHAQFKVIGADGKITYTDRAPVGNDGKVTSLSGRPGASGGVGEVTLPLDLRQAVSRYPVTLYTMTGACDPCEAARQLLRDRGIPYSEKQVQTPGDSDALERLSGGRDAPTLSVGTQTMRGLAPEVWGSYLDAAGYPRESHLPANYQYPAVTSIVERREASAARAGAASAVAPSPVELPPPPASPSGIKF